MWHEDEAEPRPASEMLVQLVHKVLGLLGSGQDFEQGLLFRNPIIPDFNYGFFPEQFFRFFEVLLGKTTSNKRRGMFPPRADLDSFCQTQATSAVTRVINSQLIRVLGINRP